MCGDLPREIINAGLSFTLRESLAEKIVFQLLQSLLEGSDVKHRSDSSEAFSIRKFEN